MSATVLFVGIRLLPLRATIPSGTGRLKESEGNCQRFSQHCRMSETGGGFNRSMRPTVADPHRSVICPNLGHSDAPSPLTKWLNALLQFQDVELIPEGFDQLPNIVFFVIVEDRAHAECAGCNQIFSIVVDEDTLFGAYSNTS